MAHSDPGCEASDLSEESIAARYAGCDFQQVGSPRGEVPSCYLRRELETYAARRHEALGCELSYCLWPEHRDCVADAGHYWRSKLQMTAAPSCSDLEEIILEVRLCDVR